jgi:non-ribosomal peptide synthase protein (TIGR01720 family)
VAHHLAIDVVSWGVLLEDLAAAYAAPEKALPAGPSWSRWARALGGEASAGALAELPWWRAVPPAAPLPRDLSARGRGAESDAMVVHGALSREETHALLRETAGAYHAQINELLLTALSRTLQRWTGSHGQTIALEGHGREAFAGAPAVEGAVGWFTSLFPVRLDLPGGAADAGAALKAVKEQLRAVPRHGFGYGLLRYLGPPAARAELAAQPWPEICFNYLGQLDSSAPAEGFRTAAESRGQDHGAQNSRPFLLEINAAVRDGALDCAWSYSRAHHREATVQRLADAFVRELRGLIGGSAAAEAGSAALSDFTATGLSQSDLDKVLARLK